MQIISEQKLTEWLVGLLHLLAGIVNQNEDLSRVVIKEAEYQQLSAVLDDLIYGVGEDEDHPLSAIMTLVGLLIKTYEDEHCPKLVDLFPELAEDTPVEADSENNDTTAAISGRIDTDFADAFLSIGYLLSETGKGEKAISAYDLAIRIKPDHVPAYMNRGIAKYACGDYRSAIEDHNKAIELMPNYPGTYVNRGNVKFRLGQYESAIDDYNAAINVNPDFADAYVNRAQAKIRLSWITDAKSDFQTAVELAKQQGQEKLKITIEQMIQKLGEIEQ